MAIVKELLKQLFQRPATIKHPFEKRPLFKGFRGRPIWDMKRCNGCESCYRVCPSGAIQIFGKGVKLEVTHYLSRCLFCGQCAEVCPVNVITMAEEYELAEEDQANLVIEYNREGKARN